MAGPSSRRTPWPFDALIAGTGVMLVPQQAGLLVGKKTTTFENVTPTDYSYQSLPPFLEQTFALRRVQGYGERVQTTRAQGQRARYGLYIDNVGGLTILGPDLSNQISPPTTGELRGFVDALHGGVLTQFILAGQYVLRRTGDNAGDQVVSHDFGAGRIVQQGARFKDATGGPTDGFYVALDNSELWRYDGAAWAQMGTSATIPAQFVVVLQDELWRGYGNHVSKLNDGADPTVAGNWAAPIALGDASSVLTWLAVQHMQLYVFKDDGSIHSVTSDGTDTELFPATGTSRIATQGRNAVAWMDWLWARRGDGLVRLDDGGSGSGIPRLDITGRRLIGISPAGPGLFVENDSEVQGYPVAFAGWQTWHGFLALVNPANGASYLVKYGQWLNPDAEHSSEFQFSPDWNGALAKWAGKTITSLAVSGIQGTNDRLYVGFADGSICWIVLPRGSPNPLSDANCRFNAVNPGELYWPLHTMVYQADTKAFHAFTAFGPHLSTTEYATQEWRLDASVPYTPLSDHFTAAGQRLDLPNGTSGVVLDTVTKLHTGSNLATPVLEGMALHEAVRPALKLTYSLTVDARSYAGKRNGSVDRRTASQIRSALKAAADASGLTTVILPDEASVSAQVVDYAERMRPDNARAGLGWQVDLVLVEYATRITNGTIGRLSAYRIGDLTGYVIGQLSTL